jgi:hypothetical protein
LALTSLVRLGTHEAHDETFGLNLQRASRTACQPSSHIKANDLRSAQRCEEADKQQRSVAQPGERRRQKANLNAHRGIFAELISRGVDVIAMGRPSSPTGDDAEEIAALGEMIDVDNDDPEDFVQFEREEMESAELWERVIADLTEIEKRIGGRVKSPTTAIIETCLKTRGALGRK